MRARRWILGGLSAIAVVYALLLALLRASEDSLVYHPLPYSEGMERTFGGGFEDRTLTTRGGATIHALHFRREGARRHVLFFHGNGGNAYLLARPLASLSESLSADVLAVDYRGYGKSAGAPSERALYEDGEAAYDELSRLAGGGPIVVMGHSLGGAVAVHVASVRPARALVLENTFDELPRAAGSHYPWVPTGLLMKNRFPSRQTIERYRGPLFAAHAKNDEVIPFRLGRALFDAAPSSPKRFFVAEAGGHNDPMPPAYWVELSTFLQEIER